MNHRFHIFLSGCCLIFAAAFCNDLSADSLNPDVAGANQTQLRIGIVNMGRILDAHPEIKLPRYSALHDSREMFREREKNRLIDRILLAVAYEAEVQHLDLVLDSSGKSAGGSFFVLRASGVIDLTEQMLQAIAD